MSCPHCGSGIGIRDEYEPLPDEPPVGSGWFADEWPGVLWYRLNFGAIERRWLAYLDDGTGNWTYKPWSELQPGRPAVPAKPLIVNMPKTGGHNAQRRYVDCGMPGFYACFDCGSLVRHGYLLGHDMLHDAAGYPANLADADDPNAVVTYADHLAAVDAAVQAERERVLSRLGQWQEHSPLGGKTYAAGRADALREAVEAVEALPTRGGPYSGYTLSRNRALAALCALQKGAE